MNTGYRRLKLNEPDSDARIEELGLRLQRREKVTDRPFIPLQLHDIENQWNGLIDFERGRHKEMSMEAARACQVEVSRVFKFTPRAYIEKRKLKVGKMSRVMQVRRVAFEDIGLRQCECSDGAIHFDLDPDAAIDAVELVMRDVIDATDAEEAHNAAWAVDALITTLANHGISVNYPKLWRQLCPPLERTIPTSRLAAYKAWNAKWTIIAEDEINNEVVIALDRMDYFHRAKSLLSEHAARDERRPLEPPAHWEPPED